MIRTAGIAWGTYHHPITLAVIEERTLVAYEHYHVSDRGIVAAFVTLSTDLARRSPHTTYAEQGGIGGLAFKSYLPPEIKAIRPHDDHITAVHLAIEDGKLTIPGFIKPLIRFSYAILSIALAYKAAEDAYG